MCINKRGCDNVKFKIMAGTLSIIVMLSTTPTLAQAHIAGDKSRVLLMGQSEIVAQQGEESEVLQAQVKALNIDTTGLTEDEIRTQIKTIGPANQLKTLQARANALNIDISGLTNDQVRTKIKKAERANTLTHLLAQAKTLGIGVAIGTSS